MNKHQRLDDGADLDTQRSRRFLRASRRVRKRDHVMLVSGLGKPCDDMPYRGM